MDSPPIYPIAGMLLYAIGLHAIFARSDLLRRIIATNTAASGVFIFLIGSAPVGPDGPDPVPQALVLTGIVISISVMAYALSLLRRLIGETGHPVVDDDDSPT